MTQRRHNNHNETTTITTTTTTTTAANNNNNNNNSSSSISKQQHAACSPRLSSCRPDSMATGMVCSSGCFFISHSTWKAEGLRARGGEYSLVACLSRLIINHASLSRRNTLPILNSISFMHNRSNMTIDPRILTMPGRSTSGYHRPGRHRVHQRGGAGRGG